jgi:hypothetical protein
LRQHELPLIFVRRQAGNFRTVKGLHGGAQ